MKAIHWIPRLISIALIGLLLLLSFDVFEEDTIGEILVGFLMHNIPTFILILMTLLAWKRPLIGAVTYTLAGLFYIFVVYRIMNLSFLDGLISISILSLPALLIGLLFYLDWKHQKKLKIDHN